MEFNIAGFILCFYIFINLFKSHESIPTTPWCPLHRYSDDDGLCKLCYANCHEGCTGPGSHLGPGGCRSCWQGLEVNHVTVTCMSPFSSCPAGYFRKTTIRDGIAVNMCKTCHPVCKTCSGAGVSHCHTCKYLRRDGVCVRSCPAGYVTYGRRRRCISSGGRFDRRQPFYLRPYRDRERS